MFHLNLGWNSIDSHHLSIISDYLKRNLKNAEKNGLPLIKDEILHLLKSDEGKKISEKQILDNVSKIKAEKSKIEEWFTKDLVKFESAKVNDKVLYDNIKTQKWNTLKEIDSLDTIEENIEEKVINWSIYRIHWNAEYI